jgi:homocysteine S-methyltransferase
MQFGTTMSTASGINPLTSTSLLDWFARESSPTILLIDGGVSTYLEHVLAKRRQVFSSRELWSSSLLLDGLDDDVIDCHSAFAAAGADILSTVTYQCHFGVASCSFKDKPINDEIMTGMMRKGIVLARQCTKRYVAASLGSYGAALADGSEYRGDYKGITREMLRDFHSRRIDAIVTEQPDAIAFETVPNADEVSILAELVRESSLSSVAVWISLGCSNDHQLNDGTELETVLDEIRRIDPTGAFINAIGFNCCSGKHVSNLLRILTLHMATNGPKRGIVFYPNSGEEWDATHANWKEESGGTSPNEFADEMHHAVQVVEQTWATYRINESPMPRMIIGGCCRTTPATILALRDMIDEREADIKAAC